MRRLLVLFAREPAPGRVKTRLAAALGDGRAADLYSAFLADLAPALAGGREWTARVACADGIPAPRLAALLSGWAQVAQAAGDLGARLAATFSDGARGGFPLVAVAGTDAPFLSAEDVRGAFEALGRGADAAFAPAPDGGFSLVALREEVDAGALFSNVRWSTPHALADCRERAAALGLSVALLPEVADVDLPADLDPLRARLKENPSAAPATARLLGAWEAA